ncbi:cuticle protein 16.5-like [Neodiprion virginianus]|uniref:cuticle protein 16.5-like n=1 Tax=Neodiprion virginianus TaxID=2961670 RepID=UPI001EE74B99|nr:cuticle protein 16.5-like [Neodiprion virginianus]
MFKLIFLSAFVAVAFARPSAHHALVAGPAVVGRLVSEKTVESHGNTVVHNSAPLIHAAVPAVAYAAATPLVAAVPAVPAVHAVHAVPQAHLISEKTIESHGNSVVHGTAPVISYAAAVPAVRYAAAVPVAPHSALISEKSVSSYGHSIVHQGSPVVHTLAAAPALTYSAYAHPAISVW